MGEEVEKEVPASPLPTLSVLILGGKDPVDELVIQKVL